MTTKLVSASVVVLFSPVIYAATVSGGFNTRLAVFLLSGVIEAIGYAIGALIHD